MTKKTRTLFKKFTVSLQCTLQVTHSNRFSVDYRQIAVQSIAELHFHAERLVCGTA